MMLVDSRDRKEGENWKIVSCNTSSDGGGDYFSINRPVHVDMEGFKWNLRDCNICGGWTHPAFIFCEDQLMEEEWLKVEFEHHSECSYRWNCTDCHISKGGKVDAGSVDKNNVAQGVVQFTFFYPLKKGLYASHKSIAIRMFALSVPIDKREILRAMQCNLGIIKEGDFQEIKKIWEKEPDYYYKDWTPVHW
jgi:hypothetical protein